MVDKWTLSFDSDQVSTFEYPHTVRVVTRNVPDITTYCSFSQSEMSFYALANRLFVGANQKRRFMLSLADCLSGG